MSDVHQPRGAVAPVESVAWAATAFAALNLSWKLAPAKKGAVRVLGVTKDEAALMDLTIRGERVRAASAVVPIKPEYTLLLTFLLAALVEKATLQEADAWLARALNRLRKDRPSETVAPWHGWRVILTTNTLGLLTMQVR
jgi:hypothetical protein